MSATAVDLTKLADHFAPTDIEWRIGQSGKKADGTIWAKAFAYITNRAIQDRLDAVVGPGYWRNEFKPWEVGTPGVLCGLSLKLDGEWVTKWDGAEQTDMEAMKGGLSGAMKRAAVQWGIGRYLYDLPEGWAKVSERGAHYATTKDKAPFRWDPPDLPRWALPAAPAVTPPADSDSVASIKNMLPQLPVDQQLRINAALARGTDPLKILARMTEHLIASGGAQ